MNVDKYCEDGLVFSIVYEMNNGMSGMSHFMFPIDYTVEQVQSVLTQEPHNLKILEVYEGNYVLKMNSAFSNQDVVTY